MSHFNQQHFCIRMKSIFPFYFRNRRVLEIGSQDINGNARYLFRSKDYTGIDLSIGKGVDAIGSGHTWKGEKYDAIVCLECLEHDVHWKETVLNSISLLKEGGVFLMTCATTGRPEHGTTATSPHSSPFTTDYYCNV